MLRIADHLIDPPFILAPLAGYSDLAFRLLCREYGAGMCVSEMISCHGLIYGQRRTMSMLATTKEEHPFAFQLFGADPEIMGKAAQIMARFSPDFVDINMGCPVPKVTKRGAGAALMAHPRLAAQIIERVRQMSGLPVTVKFRSGVDSSAITADNFARMAQDAGAAAVIVHARTWSQGFTGKADWTVIARVKKSVSIPVIGNGDIHSVEQGMALMQDTGCDGIMIGRAALGNPWVFSKSGRPADLSSIIGGALRHLELIERHRFPTESQLGYIKNHIGRYFKHLPGSAALRKTMYESPDYNSLKKNLSSLNTMR